MHVLGVVDGCERGFNTSCKSWCCQTATVTKNAQTAAYLGSAQVLVVLALRLVDRRLLGPHALRSQMTGHVCGF